MKIMQLQRENIPLVTKGGNQALVDEITKALDKAESHGNVLYVRYGPMFLQRLEVDGLNLAHPGLQAHLNDETMWEDQRPNSIQPYLESMAKQSQQCIDAWPLTKD